MTNIRLYFLHRDQGNWKDYLDVVLSNPENLTLEVIEREVRKRLIDGDYLYAGLAGIPESVYSESGNWHEFDRLEAAADDETARMSLDQFLERLEKAMPRSIKIHKVPRGIPIRLAVSWLEFLRELRACLITVLCIIRRDTVVWIWPRDDWDLLEETLLMDAQSSAFEPGLRQDIARALEHGQEIQSLLSQVKIILRKGRQIEKRIDGIAKRLDV